MNNNTKEKYNFWKDIDGHITKPRLHYRESSGSFYPSEASIQYKDKHGHKKTEGGCLRASWYRVFDFPKRPDKPRMHYIWALGKAVENIIIEQVKQKGLWVANSVKMEIRLDNYVVSGEIDGIFKYPEEFGGEEYIAEVKSFYGYKAKAELCGNRNHKAFPKVSNLIQLFLYLYKTRDIYTSGKLIYQARDDDARTSFTITLKEHKGDFYPAIKHDDSNDEGEIIKWISINRILERFDLLSTYVDAKQLPPRDYEKAWSAEKVEEYHKCGKVAKTNYEKWKKNPEKNPVGDFNCSYCSWEPICYSKDPDQKPNKKEEK